MAAFGRRFLHCRSYEKEGFWEHDTTGVVLTSLALNIGIMPDFNTTTRLQQTKFLNGGACVAFSEDDVVCIKILWLVNDEVRTVNRLITSWGLSFQFFSRGALLFEMVDLRIHHQVMQRGRQL